MVKVNEMLNVSLNNIYYINVCFFVYFYL